MTEGTLDASEPVLQEIVELQKEFFETLDLHFQVLDMPAVDLGAPAYGSLHVLFSHRVHLDSASHHWLCCTPTRFRKVDIEAWMPGRDKYGEVRP